MNARQLDYPLIGSQRKDGLSVRRRLSITHFWLFTGLAQSWNYRSRLRPSDDFIRLDSPLRVELTQLLRWTP